MRRGIGAMLEYRVESFIWMLTNAMPLVMLAVWYSMSEGGPIAGYTQSDFISYYLLLAFVRQMTTVWVIWEIDHDIRHGDLSIKLLYPLNPLHDYLAYHIADRFVRIFTLIPFVLLAWLLFPTMHFQVTLLNVVLFVTTMIAAWFLRFMQQYIFGLFAFWISESMTLNDIWYAASTFLGGLIAPLDLFPPAIMTVANLLPFRYMLSFPVEIMLGRLTPPEVFFGVGMTVFWLVVSIVTYRFLWSKGLKQFSAYGA